MPRRILCRPGFGSCSRIATRQKDSAATTGEVYCTLSCVMTYVDAENDSRAEDPVSRVENALRSAKKLGGSQLVVIEPRDRMPSYWQ